MHDTAGLRKAGFEKFIHKDYFSLHMPYNEKLAGRIREALQHLPKVEEKKMFRGVTFMVNDKCV